MSFGHIRLLYLLLLVPVLIVAYAFDGQRRRRALSLIGHLPMLKRMIASSSPAKRRGRAILTVAAVGCICIALARPQTPGRAKLTESRGLDLVVALDFSRSMLAKDIYPTRLDRAKRELDHLIDSLKGDRVGLVAFAGETMSYPLTIDYEAAKLFWRDLGPADMPVGGTDLGRAIRASMQLLQRGKKENDKRKGAQVILLLTDGEDTEGQGVAAAREAAAQGIRVYTLGIGSAERPFVQLTDEEGKTAGYLSDQGGEPVRVGLDEAALRQIAAATGGEFVTLDPRRFGVERVQSAIAGLERTQEQARFEREPEEVGRFFLLPAFILLLIEAAIGERRRERKAQAAAPPAATAVSNVQRAAVIFLVLFPFLTGFDLFLRRDPNVEEGNKELAAGHADKALEAFDRAAGALPDEPIVRYDRGTALYQLGKYPEAQKEFLHATESHDPALRADAYYNMGNSLMKQERYKDALDAFKHTLTLRPEDRRAKWNLELALRRLKEEEQKKQQQQQQSQNDQKKDQKQDQKQDQQQDQKDKQQQQQQQQQQQAQQQEQKDQKQQPAKPDEKKDEKQAAAAKKEAPREIDKQDAEAVLDALERVEPTVQKELARRRAGNRRPTKDW